MDNSDENIHKAFQQNTVIPNVVEQKCQEAYKLVRENEASPVRKKKHLAAKICLPIAASFALVMGIGFANPAFAAQIPIVKNVFQMFKTETVLNSKDDLVTGDQGKYAKSVSQTASSNVDTENGVNIKAQQYSCDGTNLYVTYSATVSNPQLVNCDSIMINILKQNKESLNGQEIHPDQALCLQKTKDGSFVAMQHYDLTTIPNLPDKFNVSVKINGLVGMNSKIQVAKTNSNVLTGTGSKETPIDGTWSFSFEVTKDTSHDKIYTVSQVKNGVKLNKVILTPGTTEIEYVIPDSMNGSAVVIKDNTGKKLNGIGGQDTPISGGTLSRMKYAMTSKSAKSLTITVIDKNADSSTLASFTVPLTK